MRKYDLDQMCLFDDAFFAACFRGHPECTRELLKVILGMPNIRIIKHRVQNQLSNNKNRGVRLDVFAVNEDDKSVYDIEVENTHSKYLPMRARYYSALIDSRATIKQKQDYRELPKSFVIFICKDDIMGKKEPVYWYTRKCNGSYDELNDGTNIIFVNGAYRGNDAVGDLMSDFMQIDTDKINNRLLAQRIIETRAEAGRLKKGDDKMIVTEFDKVLMKEREEGREEGVVDMAKKMLAGGKLTVEEIAEYSSLPVERVRELAKGA